MSAILTIGPKCNQCGKEVNALGRDRMGGVHPGKACGPAIGDKVLTIRQPAATLIIAGCKAVENRKWPTTYRGLLWIHSAKAPPTGSWSDYIDGEPIGPDDPVTVDDFALPPWSALVLGSIIGSVEIYDCVR